MITISSERSCYRPACKISDIPIGATFRGTIGEYSGLFLRCYSCICLLQNPRKTWSGDDAISVADYEAVDIHITVKEQNA